MGDLFQEDPANSCKAANFAPPGVMRTHQLLYHGLGETLGGMSLFCWVGFRSKLCLLQYFLSMKTFIYVNIELGVGYIYKQHSDIQPTCTLYVFFFIVIRIITFLLNYCVAPLAVLQSLFTAGRLFPPGDEAGLFLSTLGEEAGALMEKICVPDSDLLIYKILPSLYTTQNKFWSLTKDNTEYPGSPTKVI